MAAVAALIGQYMQGLRLTKRQDGARAALRYMLWPLIDFHRAIVLCRSLGDPIPEPQVEAGTTIRPATPDDAALLGAIVPPARIKRFERKLSDGEICLIALSRGRIIALGWAGFHAGPTVQQTPLRIGPKDVYLWGGYALPEYRSRGIVTALAFTILRCLKERGYERTYQITDRHNGSALKLAHKMLCMPVARIVSLRLLKWRLSRCGPIAESVNEAHPFPGPGCAAGAGSQRAPQGT